tara:strand:+ start:559 stop:759 length:201 start_codon:yes stop_codon:yes gene_type:complete
MAKKKQNKLDIKEISKEVSEYRKELLNLRFQKSSGQLQNTSQFKKIRKKIAQSLTTLKNIEGEKNA